MDALHAFVHQLVKSNVLMALGIFSIVAVVATAVIVPVVIARMPADYFVRSSDERSINPVLVVLKNIAGVLLVLLGIAMLVLPGQGILTVVLGLGLVDFPGRRRFELKVISRPSVLKAVNALRRRAGRAPLDVPQPE
jgi:hypothetical protein